MAKKLILGILLISVMMTALVFFTDTFSEQEEVADAAVLRRGSTGSVVRTMQTRLRNWGYYSGSVDGIFGPQTEAAVKYFQRTHRLVADGIVGTKTAAAIGIRLTPTQASSGGVSSSDAYLLARVIYGEARGEPYTGQVAIAAVILNRVRSSDFPNTIAGVIYQPHAFTVVSDGQINLTPDSTAQKAANDAINGWDPTYGCLFYYNPVTATNAWIRQKQIKLTIGRHVFCL